LFDHLDRHRDAGHTFHEAMTNLAALISQAVLLVHDFADVELLVDVGGGYGQFLTDILTVYPDMRGILVDTPAVIDVARRQLAGQPSRPRCTLVPGNLLEPLPRGGDLYLLSGVIHDWDDDEAIKILNQCRRAMAPDGKVLVVESILAAGNGSAFGALLDLNMLVMTGGRERTEQEFRRLFDAAGLVVTRITPTLAPQWTIEGSCQRGNPGRALQVALPDPSVVEPVPVSRLERLDELVELGVVEIGDGPEGHAVAGPVAHLEAAEGPRWTRAHCRRRRRSRGRHQDSSPAPPARGTTISRKSTGSASSPKDSGPDAVIPKAHHIASGIDRRPSRSLSLNGAMKAVNGAMKEAGRSGIDWPVARSTGATLAIRRLVVAVSQVMVAVTLIPGEDCLRWQRRRVWRRRTKTKTWIVAGFCSAWPGSALEPCGRCPAAR
jgi:SAM-dependent methyltransferase